MFKVLENINIIYLVINNHCTRINLVVWLINLLKQIIDENWIIYNIDHKILKQDSDLSRFAISFNKHTHVAGEG